jgi:hypothetical protein
MSVELSPEAQSSLQSVLLRAVKTMKAQQLSMALHGMANLDCFESLVPHELRLELFRALGAQLKFMDPQAVSNTIQS